jgi:predicted RNase H-like HicB family nuclease
MNNIMNLHPFWFGFILFSIAVTCFEYAYNQHLKKIAEGLRKDLAEVRETTDQARALYEEQRRLLHTYIRAHNLVCEENIVLKKSLAEEIALNESPVLDPEEVGFGCDDPKSAEQIPPLQLAHPIVTEEFTIDGNRYMIQFDRETDGRYTGAHIAEVVGFPGCIAYGKSKFEAANAAVEIARATTTEKQTKKRKKPKK